MARIRELGFQFLDNPCIIRALSFKDSNLCSQFLCFLLGFRLLDVHSVFRHVHQGLQQDSRYGLTISFINEEGGLCGCEVGEKVCGGGAGGGEEEGVGGESAKGELDCVGSTSRCPLGDAGGSCTTAAAPGRMETERDNAERGDATEVEAERLWRLIGDGGPEGLGRETVVIGGVDFPLLVCFCGL